MHGIVNYLTPIINISVVIGDKHLRLILNITSGFGVHNAYHWQ